MFQTFKKLSSGKHHDQSDLFIMLGMETATMNFCMACGGNLKADLVTHRDPSARMEYKIVENVPALICQNCDEYFLSNDVVDEIEQLTEQGQPIRQVVTAFYDFALR